MKVIAHRGWSAGEGENTIDAFKKALSDSRVHGVELDVWQDENGRIVVTHNKPVSGAAYPTLSEVFDLFAATDREIYVECKAWSMSMQGEIASEILGRSMQDRVFVFAFPEVAKDFPWQDRKGIMYGVITRYPWHIASDISRYHPDMLLFGWTNVKERRQFKLWWTLLGSLRCLVKKYAHIRFVAGVAFTQNDLDWLTRQNLYASTADKPFVWK